MLWQYIFNICSCRKVTLKIDPCVTCNKSLIGFFHASVAFRSSELNDLIWSMCVPAIHILMYAIFNFCFKIHPTYLILFHVFHTFVASRSSELKYVCARYWLWMIFYHTLHHKGRAAFAGAFKKPFCSFLLKSSSLSSAFAAASCTERSSWMLDDSPNNV